MIRENLLKALASIVILFIAMGALGFWLEDELIVGTNWMIERIGFAGLCLILLVTDMLVTPVSPDILLLVVAKSDLAEHWPAYVLILGMVSAGAGMLGWCIGRWLGHLRLTRQLFGQFNEKQRGFVRKYGFWAIVLGATTPLPYSVTCWTAGILGVSWTTVLAASVLFRIPRFFIYYLVIASTIDLFG